MRRTRMPRAPGEPPAPPATPHVAAPPTTPSLEEAPHKLVQRVYRWDLDKTYLKSEFETFRDLVKSAFEGAEQKQSVPGAAALLRELKKGEGVRVCFISGSPRQM